MRDALAAGAQPDHVDEADRTALMLASQNGFHEVVKKLLEQSADADRRASDGRTSLMLACQSGHMSVAKLLLDARASIDAQDRDGDTALLLAAQNAHSACVQLLLEDSEGRETKRVHEEWSVLNWSLTTSLRRQRGTRTGE